MLIFARKKNKIFLTKWNDKLLLDKEIPSQTSIKKICTQVYRLSACISSKILSIARWSLLHSISHSFGELSPF